MPQQNKNSIAVVIAAAGSGLRLGRDMPKAFVPLAGKCLFAYSLEIFHRHPAVSRIILVVPPDSMDKAGEMIYALHTEKNVTVAPGGIERWQSVQNGVEAAGQSFEWIITHDAARPFVTKEVIDSLLQKRSAYKCAITATPIEDTIRRFEHDRCIATLDRSMLIRVGTPQLFHRLSLIDAFAHAGLMTPSPTDEAMLMERCGIDIGFAWGDPLNFKITTQSDLDLAEAILSQRNE
jgi:2-C-methyl-D-erythritol 4-phosphate cytidylyltransferase